LVKRVFKAMPHWILPLSFLHTHPVAHTHCLFFLCLFASILSTASSAIVSSR
jgi:hypothetical protein